MALSFLAPASSELANIAASGVESGYNARNQQRANDQAEASSNARAA